MFLELSLRQWRYEPSSPIKDPERKTQQRPRQIRSSTARAGFDLSQQGRVMNGTAVLPGRWQPKRARGIPDPVLWRT